MTNIDKLRRETADIKEDAVAKHSSKIEDYILKLLTEYYYSYVNNDMARFHAAADHLEDAITIAYGQHDNVSNFINYCRVIILTKLMNTIFNRDESLKIPNEAIAINTDNKLFTGILSDYNISKTYDEVTMEQDDYFKELEREMMTEGDYVKHLIRPDINVDFIRTNMNTLESILTDEGMAAIHHHIRGDE